MNQALFDLEKIRKNRRRVLKGLGDHGFLFDRAASRLIDNLKDIQRDFQDILIIGRRGANKVTEYLGADKDITIYDIDEDGDEIPLYESEQFDCIICLPYLHTVNNVPGFLMAVKSYLKPDGLFLNAFFGGQSLQELRQSIMAVEIKAKGGAGQHIHPMIDHYDYAALMQKAGFALPVVDYDRFTVHYSDLDKLYNDLYGMGEGNALVNRENTITALKTQIKDYYSNHFYDDGFIATFDIIHGIGWKAHENQQQPAKRGSGQVSMTEIL